MVSRTGKQKVSKQVYDKIWWCRAVRTANLLEVRNSPRRSPDLDKNPPNTDVDTWSPASLGRVKKEATNTTFTETNHQQRGTRQNGIRLNISRGGYSPSTGPSPEDGMESNGSGQAARGQREFGGLRSTSRSTPDSERRPTAPERDTHLEKTKVIGKKSQTAMSNTQTATTPKMQTASNSNKQTMQKKRKHAVRAKNKCEANTTKHANATNTKPPGRPKAGQNIPSTNPKEHPTNAKSDPRRTR